jgi:hypothetical protein
MSMHMGEALLAEEDRKLDEEIRAREPAEGTGN